MSLERVDSLGFDSFRSILILIFIDGEIFIGLTTSLTGGLIVSLTTLLIEGSKEDEETKNNGHKGKAMKHKDHVRKTQLV